MPISHVRSEAWANSFAGSARQFALTHPPTFIVMRNLVFSLADTSIRAHCNTAATSCQATKGAELVQRGIAVKIRCEISVVVPLVQHKCPSSEPCALCPGLL